MQVRLLLCALFLGACLACPLAADCPVGDLNGDCRVDWTDVELFASQWLDAGCVGSDCADLDGLSGVDSRDFALLAANWLEESTAITVVINEFMAKNDGSVVDEYGDDDDWIELYNYGQRPVDVGGLYMTDRLTDPLMWRIADNAPALTTIPAGGYLLIWADDEGSEGPLHASFKLGADGEEIGLYDSTGTAIDTITFGPQQGDESYGRLPDGSDNWQVFVSPTPGTPNRLEAANIIITEIMYHPYHEEETPEPIGEEYIELFNAGARSADLEGWRFSDGVEFTFPQISLDAGAYVVVAADVNSFSTKYPSVTNVIGGWTDRLSNSGENVELVDASGVRIDVVEYADQGDWAVRELGPEDFFHRGWTWSDAHDGDGKSLELINPFVSNEYGQNWGVSDSNDGTPGVENPIVSLDTAPLIMDVDHYPVVPGAEESVTVTARIMDELSFGLSVQLFYRVDESQYTDRDEYPQYDPNTYSALVMSDEGAYGDGAYGDGIYGVTIPAQADGSIVEFYIEASDLDGRVRTWPAPSYVDGVPEQVTNLLYMVDSAFEGDVYWEPGSQPVYHLVMTRAERDRLIDIGNREGGEYNSDAQMNATFVSVDGVDIAVRHNVGVRNRGHGSRNDPPNNYRVNFVHGRPWKGVEAINLNTKFTFLQTIGSAVFRAAVLPQPVATAAQVRVNGENLAESDGPVTYGTYAHLEVVDGDFAREHFPDDNDGNGYKCMRDDGPADFRYLGEDPSPYRRSYFKQTNESQADWSDIIDLCYVMSRSSDDDYISELNRVINVEQWLRVLAMNALLDNNETSLANGYGDDYFLYRGLTDTRFRLIQHDLDSIFGYNGSSATRGVFRATALASMRRFLEHPQIAPRYYFHLKDLLETTLSEAQLRPLLEESIGGFVPANVVDGIMSFMARRRQHVLSIIPSDLAIDTRNLSGFSDGWYLVDTNVVELEGWADAIGTGSVLVNGRQVSWQPVDGEWSTRVTVEIQSDMFVGVGSEWRYFNEYTDLGSDWYLDVADGNWPAGYAELGYGDTGRPETTTIGYIDTDPCTPGDQRNITTYFTHSFDVNDVSEYSRLALRILRDDGAVVYLNGVEIARSNMPGGAVDYNTPALSGVGGSTAETRFYGGAIYADDDDFTNIDVGLLQNGINKLAVEIHQIEPDSADISFDLELSGILHEQPSVDSAVLSPGVNRVLVQTFDGPSGTGNELDRSFVDIYYQDGDMSDVSGVLGGDTVLDAASGPWHITANLVVRDGVTLTIEPGSTLFFEEGVGLTVEQGGRLLAEGTQYKRIRMTHMPNSGAAWSGMKFDHTSEENRLCYVDIEFGDGQGESIDVQHSRVLIDNVIWGGTNNMVLNVDHPTATIRNSFFPSITGTEPVHGVGLSGDESLIFDGCIFGATTGYNDIIDFSGGQRPGPIVQFYDNVFLGGGDDGIDIDGADAHIEGNVFLSFANGENGDTGSTTASAVATDAGSEVALARNVFLGSDHHVLLKSGAWMTAQNNTFIGATMASINFGEPGRGVSPGDGGYFQGNVFYGNAGVFHNIFDNPLYPDYGPDPMPEIHSSIIPSEWHSYGQGNIDCEPVFVNSGGDFRLSPGSGGAGSGPCGLDMGAFVPAGAAICGEPGPVTYRAEATLTVGGPGITAYKYSVNDPNGPWSAETPVDMPIDLTGLADGASYKVYVIGKNSAGVWQSEEDARASRTWMVDTLYSQLRINEILAHTHGSDPDVIELYYDGPGPLDLTGMSLTDDPGDPYRFVFSSTTVASTVMNPGEYMVLYGDTDSNVANHLGFALSADGESLYLYDKPSNGGGVLDSVSFGPQINDYSIGRVGFEGQWKLNTPTFGAANVVQPLGDARRLRINEWFANGEVLLEDDFIELHNPGPLPVDLSSLYITDEPVTQQDKCMLGPLSFIDPNGYAAFVADRGSDGGHLNFRLSADGEMLVLYDSELVEIDKVLYGPQTTDVSQGRAPDGSDEFDFFALPTPGVANGSIPVTNVSTVVLVPEASDKLVMVPLSAEDADPNWVGEIDFNDSQWLRSSGGPGGVGYERSSGYQNMISLDVEPEMYRQNSGCYVRIRFTVGDNDLSGLTELILKVRYDDGYVAHLNGVEIDRRNFTGAPQWDSRAEASHEARSGDFDDYVDVSAFIGELKVGENLLAIQGLNTSMTSSDFIISAELEGVITETTNGEYPYPRALALLDGLRITELMYHAPDGSDYDYIELTNISNAPLDVNGVRFSEGVEFTFGPMVLEPGEAAVVAGSIPNFRLEYGFGVSVAGQFSGNLSNGGEDIVLLLPAPLDAAIMRFSYSDVWYLSTDGDGLSLGIKDANVHPAAWSDKESWSAIAPSPGNF